MEIHEYIRNRIKELRDLKGINESQLSKEVGYNASYLSNMKKDGSVPPYQALVSICNFFHITMSEFFIGYINPDVNEPMQVRIAKCFEKLTGMDGLDTLLKIIELSTQEELQSFLLYLKKIVK